MKEMSITESYIREVQIARAAKMLLTMFLATVIIVNAISASNFEEAAAKVKEEALVYLEQAKLDYEADNPYSDDKIEYSILRVEEEHSYLDGEDYYLLSIRIDITSDDSRFYRTSSIISFFSLEFNLDDGTKVNTYCSDTDNMYLFEQMIYVYFNGELIEQPD
jgi:hypothetical protein